MGIRDFTPNEEGIDPEVDLNVHHLGFCLVYVPVSLKAAVICALHLPIACSMDEGAGWKRSPEDAVKDFDWIFDNALTFRTIPGDQVVTPVDDGGEIPEARTYRVNHRTKKVERSN